VFVLSETEPTAANTGLNVLGLTTSDLTVVNGDLTINNTYVAANGTNLDRLWVKGHVIMTATSAVTISNSRIQGRNFAGAAPWEAIVRARSGSAPVTATLSFVNCEIFAVQPDVGISTAAGERLGRFFRCNLWHGSDGIDYWGIAPDVQGCYLHDYVFWANDPKHTNDGQHPGWSHNDHIQNSSSSGGVVRGNSIDCRVAVGLGDVATLTGSGFPLRNWGCGVMLTSSSGNITNAVVRQNWIRWGEVQVAMPLQNGSFDTGNSWEVYGNRHDLGQHGYGSGPYSKQIIRWGNTKGPTVASVHDNVFLSDTNVPEAMRGTLLPTATLAGPNDQTGQLIVRVTSATQ
jgi:hypothetical protein